MKITIVLTFLLLLSSFGVDAIRRNQHQHFLAKNQLKGMTQCFKVQLTKRKRNKEQVNHWINLIKETKHFTKVVNKSFLKLRKAKPKMYFTKLRNYLNTQYVGQIALGSPGNVFNVIYDTGSPNIWINSVRCKELVCKQREQYDHTKSKTFNKLGVVQEVSYGSGGLSGVMNEETVYFNGLKIPNQTINEITYDTGAILGDSHFDGVVGLAFESIAEKNDIPILDNIQKNNLLQKNIVTFYYGSDPEKLDSVMTLGGIDESLAASKIKYYPLVREDYWAVEADDILLDGESVGFCDEAPCKLIFDTGTSMMTAPQKQMEKMMPYLHLEGKECQDYKNLPTFTFVLKGDEYILTPEQYMITHTKKGEQLPNVHNHKNHEVTDCENIFSAMDINEQFGSGNTWILGDVFLTRYYTIYDKDNSRIGVAKAQNQFNDE